jgi:NADH-quinone oxidoreductase subunit J
MLTQTKAAPIRLVFQTQAVPAAIASALLAVLIALAVTSTDWGAAAGRITTATDALARLLFDEYVLAFEVVGVLILAAVIGAVFLARREREEGGSS